MDDYIRYLRAEAHRLAHNYDYIKHLENEAVKTTQQNTIYIDHHVFWSEFGTNNLVDFINKMYGGTGMLGSKILDAYRSKITYNIQTKEYMLHWCSKSYLILGEDRKWTIRMNRNH